MGDTIDQWHLERDRTSNSFYKGLSKVNQPRTAHQEKIIRNYYQNRDAIGLQKAQECITELFLSEGKKRETIWKRLESHLEKVGLKPEEIAKLRKEDDPAKVAQAIEKFN
jgi:ubiquinone biosynthesis protein COQ9